MCRNVLAWMSMCLCVRLCDSKTIFSLDSTGMRKGKFLSLCVWGGCVWVCARARMYMYVEVRGQYQRSSWISLSFFVCLFSRQCLSLSVLCKTTEEKEVVSCYHLIFSGGLRSCRPPEGWAWLKRRGNWEIAINSLSSLLPFILFRYHGDRKTVRTDEALSPKD